MVQNNKTNKLYFIGVGLLVVLMLVGTFQVGFSMGKGGIAINGASAQVAANEKNKDRADYNLLWEALRIMDEKYIEKPIDQKKALYGAISGAIAATGDEYSTFFEPKALETFKSELKGNFEGIGAQVDKKNDYIIIIAPIDESPAQKAGLLAQDLIVSINGTSTQGMSLEEAVSKIRGQKGTKVKLGIVREGKKEPFDVEIIRDVILVKSVKVKYEERTVNGKKKNIAIISIAKFGDDTSPLFENIVNDITRNKQVDGIVVDLRNNPGGYLDSAVDLASYWLPKNKLVVSEVFSDKPKQEMVSHGYERLKNYNTTILINGGSASASEILSGALRDHKFAKLIGEKTFGKGSVQELIQLGDSGAAIKVTVAKWVTPGGVNLNKDGLVPDVVIKRGEKDAENKTDTQLNTAIEELFK